MVALLSFGFAVAWRRRDRVVVRLYAVFGVVGAIGLFAVSRVFGEFFDYVIRWIWPINAIGTLAAMLAIGRAVAARRIGFAPRLRRLAVVVTAIVSIVAVLQAGSAHIPGRLDSRLVGGLATGAQTGLSPQARYLLRWHDPQALGAAGFGLVLEMERRGFHVGVDAWARAGSQPFRVQPEDSAASVLWLVVGDRAIDEFARRGDAVLLTRFDPRTPAEAARSDAVRAELDRRFNETGRRDLIDKLDIQYGTTQVRFFEHLPDDLQQLVVEYNDLRSPGAIFEVPPFAPLFTLS